MGLVSLVGIVDGFCQVSGNIELPCFSVLDRYERYNFSTPFKIINGLRDLHRTVQEAAYSVVVVG